MNFITEFQFTTLSAAAKKAYLSEVLSEVHTIKEQSSARAGISHGSAFLWMDLYGKDAITKAFKALLKTSGFKIFKNYRGSKFAWYLGSQSDLGKYDAFLNVSKFLNQAGVQCCLSDAWD